MPKATDPVRINLTRVHATYLSLSTRSTFDSPLLREMLSTYGIEDSDGTRFAVFYTTYSRSRTLHRCLATISQVLPSLPEYKFDVIYSTGELAPGLVDTETRPVIDLFDVVSDVPTEESFTCRVTFDYPADRYRSKLPLPMRLTSPDHLRDAEIQGVRFTRLEGDSILYDAIVDHGEPARIILHSIRFVYVAGFEPDLPARILEAARGISLSFGQPY